MLRITMLLAVFGLAGYALSPAPVARAFQGKGDEKERKVEDKSANNKKGTLLKAQKVEPVSSTDFAGELRLPFDSLSTLGSRIDQARTAPSPIGLVLAGIELEVAEKVSGRKAKLTSATLLKEGADLAALRDISTELKAVSLLVKDEAIAKKLQAQATKAAKRESAEAKAAKSGEKARGAKWLKVDNASKHNLRIYANGKYVGMVYAYRDGQFYLGHGYGVNTVITARAATSTRRWGPFTTTRDMNTYSVTMGNWPEDY